jgi:predicted dehydrogenase
MLDVKTATKKIGIVGCGKRIQAVLGNIPGLNKDIVVSSLFDPDERSIAATNQMLNQKARVCSNYKDVTDDPKIDWVFIGSWNCFHYEHAIAALKQGKHIFCEKPLANTFKKCVAMKKASDKANKIFSVGFTLRYSSHYRKLKELIDNGAIGKIISMEFNETLDFDHGGYIHGDWRRLTKYAGSHILEKCCHDIDMSQWIVGSLPRSVASFAGCDFFTPENVSYMDKLGKTPNGRVAFDKYPRMDYENPFTAEKDIADNQVAIFQFYNGVRASFHTNCNTNLPERRMYICGTEGTLRADVLVGQIDVAKISYSSKDNFTIKTDAHDGHGGGDYVLGQELNASIINGTKPAAGINEGLKSAVTCFGIDKACETGQVVNMKKYWDSAGISMY